MNQKKRTGVYLPITLPIVVALHCCPIVVVVVVGVEQKECGGGLVHLG